MAERTSAKKLTANQMIVRKLKETFNRNALAEDEGVNVWVMVAAAKPFQEGEENELKPELGRQKPSHRFRVVLRTSDAQAGANPYVDGSDFFLAVDEQRQTAEFVWENESFAEAPIFHGGEITSAIAWTKAHAEPLLLLCLEDPFQANDTRTTGMGDKTGDKT
jgi:hypothetical protein